MSKSVKQPIENAAKIIEKFGGIRPMSSKVNVAVTTIQGWKKRGVIPAARKAIILSAAVEHKIDLSDIFDDAPSISNEVEEKNGGNVVTTEDVKDVEEDVKPEVIVPEVIVPEVIVPEVIVSEVSSKKDEFASKDSAVKNSNFTEISIETERKAITKSVLIAASIVLIVVASIVAMLWPDFEEFGVRGNKIAALEGDIIDIKETQSMFKGLVPENWSEQLEDLKKQVEQAKESVSTTVDNVTVASKELIAANGLEERVVKLQSYVSEITNESGIYSLISRFDDMKSSLVGQNVLDSSVLELSSLLNSTKGQDDSYVNSALNAARSQSVALQQTLDNVPQNELKAAAMLLALTQVRSALNRSDEAFDNDLGLLIGLVGDDNIELKASLHKLTPHAKAGLLSAEGLQKEFRTVAGDVVVASLSGEDVSISEKAKASMNNILKIEKDGELVTGTDTQATMQKADNMMRSGNLDAALKFLKKQLKAKELKPLRPWIKKAEAVLNSRKVKKALEQAIELNIGRGYLGGSQLLNE